MCQTSYYAHPLCGCRWLAVTQPCSPGAGFSTCPSFFTGRTKPAPPCFGQTLKKRRAGGRDAAADMASLFVWATIPCPVHTLGGYYDHNSIRRIVDIKNGMRWGSGPDKDNFGIDCSCSIM